MAVIICERCNQGFGVTFGMSDGRQGGLCQVCWHDLVRSGLVKGWTVTTVVEPTRTPREFPWDQSEIFDYLSETENRS